MLSGERGRLCHGLSSEALKGHADTSARWKSCKTFIYQTERYCEETCLPCSFCFLFLEDFLVSTGVSSLWEIDQKKNARKLKDCHES